MSLLTGTLSKSQHVDRVRSLYRRSLKYNFQWAFSRVTFNFLCTDTRELFDKNRSLNDFSKIEEFIQKQEKFIEYYPEPYTSVSLLCCV